MSVNPMHQGRMLARYKAWAGKVIFDAATQLPEGEVTRPRKSVFKSMAHMLNHIYVINHSTYHRGFVADFFYQIPVQPPATDFTVYLRDARPRLD